MYRVEKAGIVLGIELRTNNIVVRQLFCAEESKSKLGRDLQSQRQVC